MKKFNLDDLDKKEPFEAPHGYFEDLPMRLQKRIEGIASRESGPHSIAIRWSLAGIAAALFVALGITFWNGTLNNTADPLDEIATADLIYFLETDAQLEVTSSEELVNIFGAIETEDSLWTEYELEMIPGDDLTGEELQQLYDHYRSGDEFLN